MTRRFTILAMAALLPLSYLQAFDIKGRAVGPDGEGVVYATYRLYAAADSTRAIVSDITDVDGTFAHGLPAAGNYRLVLSYVGLKDAPVTFSVTPSVPTADLGDIRMYEGAEALEGVTVTAQRPLVVKQIDRIAYDVQADPLTPTSTVRDILRSVPMVSVQPDGTILVNGSSDFRIFKNGRPNNSLSRNAKDLFAALPASMIKRIEVITEPGAEYDAEGTAAILNIVTDDTHVVKGVLGSAQVNWESSLEIPGGSLYLTTQVNKVTLSVYGGYNPLGGRQFKGEQGSVTTFPESGISRSEYTRSKQRGGISYFGMEGSYELDSLNLFTAELSGYNFGYSPRYVLSSSLTSAPDGTALGGFASSVTDGRTGYFDLSANFNYQHSTRRRGETYTLSYMLSTTDQNNHQNTLYSDVWGTEELPYTSLYYKYRLNFIEHTVQADWNRPFADRHQLNLGLKWINRRNNSRDTRYYEGWQNSFLRFRHITDIASVYAQYGIKVRRVNLRAGLRYEYSHLRATYPGHDNTEERTPFTTDLHDLVPSASAVWQMSDPSSLTATYAASISRPGISYLDPTVKVSPNAVSYGNADLESARRQSVKLQYMYIGKKLNFNVSADFSWINNGIGLDEFITDGDVINTTYGNIAHQRNLSLNLYSQWSVTAKTRWMVNGGASWQRNHWNGLTMCRWIPQVYTRLTQELPWAVHAEAFLWYSGGWLNSVYGYSDSNFLNNAYYGISLSREFLKDKRLSVRAGISNPFGQHYPKRYQYMTQGSYRQTAWDCRYSGPRVTLAVSYRFGSLQAQVKKTAASIKNDDLVGRKQ